MPIATASIASAAAKYGLNFADFYGLIMSESGGENLPARNVKIGNQWHKVTGAGQILDDTAVQLGIDPDDPAQNLDASAKYLASLIKKNDGDVTKAIQDYKGIKNPDTPKNKQIMSAWEKWVQKGLDVGTALGLAMDTLPSLVTGDIQTDDGKKEKSSSIIERLKTPEFLSILFVVIFLSIFTLQNLTKTATDAVGAALK